MFVNVDTKTSYVVQWFGEHTGVVGGHEYDPPLGKRGRDQQLDFSWVPQPGNFPRNILLIWEALTSAFDSNKKLSDRGATWQEAAMKSEGYDYVEPLKGGGAIYREVRNLDEMLKVKGFENVVMTSTTIGSDGKLEGWTSWAYGTLVDQKTGQKVVWVQSVTYDHNKNIILTSSGSTAVPNLKRPTMMQEFEKTSYDN